jgi:hypothetical protein
VLQAWLWPKTPSSRTQLLPELSALQQSFLIWLVALPLTVNWGPLLRTNARCVAAPSPPCLLHPSCLLKCQAGVGPQLVSKSSHLPARVLWLSGLCSRSWSSPL